jgi:hypothetical protein
MKRFLSTRPFAGASTARRAPRCLLVAVTGTVLLAACSNQQIYNAAQESQRVDCQQYPDTRYEECMARLDTPYDDYEAERRAASDDDG